jgi:Pyridoxamine 5'-phosphate oxidase
MSQVLGNQLTEELFHRLKGEAMASKEGKAIVIVTTDEAGWPHPGMLSYHEVVAKDRSSIDLAVGRQSTTARNLRRTGKITLLITDSDVNYYVKGDARQVKESMDDVSFMSLFRVTVEHLLEDLEPDAVVTSGVTFERAKKKEVEELVEKVYQGLRREP